MSIVFLISTGNDKKIYKSIKYILTKKVTYVTINTEKKRYIM